MANFSTISTSVDYNTLQNNGSTNLAYNYTTNTAYIAWCEVNGALTYDVYVASSTDFVNWNTEVAVANLTARPTTIAIGVDEFGDRICVSWSALYVSATNFSVENIGFRIKDGGIWGTLNQLTDFSTTNYIHDVMFDYFSTQFIFIFQTNGTYRQFNLGYENGTLPYSNTANSSVALTYSNYDAQAISCVIDRNTNTLRYVYSTYTSSIMTDVHEGYFSFEFFTANVDYTTIAQYDVDGVKILDSNILNIDLNINIDGDMIVSVQIDSTYDNGGFGTPRYNVDVFNNLTSINSWVSLTVPFTYQSTDTQAHLTIAGNKTYLYYVDESTQDLTRYEMNGVNGTFANPTVVSVYDPNINHDAKNITVLRSQDNSIEFILFIDEYSSSDNIVVRSDTFVSSTSVSVTIDNALNILTAKDSNVIIILAPPTILDVYKSGSSIFIVWEQRW